MKKLLSILVAGLFAVTGTAALAQDKKAEVKKEEAKPAAAAKKEETKPAAAAAKKEEAKPAPKAEVKKEEPKKKEKKGGC